MSLPLPASITLNPDGTWSRNIIPPPAPTPFLGIEGEFGYWSGQGIGYGYWPWYAGNAPWSKCAMVLINNNQGGYADYPYTGPLPAYP